MNETACPICGKLFYPSAEHVYKIISGNRVTKLCSWTCFNKKKGAINGRGKKQSNS